MSQNWPAISSSDTVNIDDLLARLDSLRSSWAGTARPSTPVAGQLFFDTDGGPIVEICTNATGPVWAGLATVLAPSELLAAILTVDGAASGLDADTLDGQHASAFQTALGYTPLDDADFTGANVLALLLGVDGAGSGLDADLLDGQSSAYYTAITARLGYTPVQRGTGTGQGTNTIHIGWLGSTLGLQVDSTDFGSTWPVSISGTAAQATTASSLSTNAVTALTADAAPIMSTDYLLTYDASAAALKKVLLQYVGAGKQTVWIPAGAMAPRNTNGCGALAVLETGSNFINYDYLPFDPVSNEVAGFDWRAPKAISTNTFTVVFVWSHPATTTNFGVTWNIAALGRGNGDALDVALGTAVTISDTGGTTDTLYVSDPTAAMTVGGTFAAEDFIKFVLWRNPAHGSDTLAVDARLHGVLLIFNTNVNTDD